MGSTLTVDNIVGATAAAKVKLPAGAVVQTLQATLTATQSIAAGTSFVDVTNLSITITPHFSTSKFLLDFRLAFGGETNTAQYFRFQGGNSGNFIGDASGNRTRAALYFGDDFGNNSATTFQQHAFMAAGQFLDAPNTGSAITYKVQARGDGNGALLINRTYANPNDANEGGVGAASFTVMEISQ
tara:strand:- start:129 stop:683 length:555 start_codon:yes stop_codon:yes gene_type:complete